MEVDALNLKVGGRYNWRFQPERLIYVGEKLYPGDRRTWHQFSKIGDPRPVWCELLTGDLNMIEETQESGGPRNG